jgi:hypothetical protein
MGSPSRTDSQKQYRGNGQQVEQVTLREAAWGSSRQKSCYETSDELAFRNGATHPKLAPAAHTTGRSAKASARFDESVSSPIALFITPMLPFSKPQRHRLWESVRLYMKRNPCNWHEPDHKGTKGRREAEE